ncbi:uncharacterized protein B0T23DRAFT_422039 [Neurospora hispaniola]|uniref:Helix-turn-helix domain-containing protein n=1 Tax=Neurospora hispaniola TaxID=588809 RepID=A0AAJ0I4D4_9PEZI|nr:hypothetical protein B0T23DRAFT_422039 [Neurospora hispaniola]
MGAGSSKVARKLPKNATTASLAAASRSGTAAAPRAPPPRVNGGQEAPSQSQMDSASSNTYEEAAAAATPTQDQFHHDHHHHHHQQPPTRTSSSSTTSSFPSPTSSGSPLDAIGDPAFAARLRQLSATVQPNPIHSPSSTVSVHPQPQLQSQHLPQSSSSSSQSQSHQFPSRRLSASQSQSQSHAQQQSPQKENIPTLLSPSFPALQSNATLTALDARKVLERKYEEEMDKFGRNDKSFQGREFLSVQMVKDVFELRKRGASEEEIERRLGLAKGVVKGVEGGGVVKAVA